jgi:hypothetical protein
MNPAPIIYIPGSQADAMGGDNLQRFADLLSTIAGEVVEVHTYGPTVYHGRKRFIGAPGDVIAATAALNWQVKPTPAE